MSALRLFRAALAVPMLQCSAVIVLHGAQCGPIHLNIVAHIKQWLWTVTDPAVSEREVEGQGMVDYLNVLWCIDSKLDLYEGASGREGKGGVEHMLDEPDCQKTPSFAGDYWIGLVRARVCVHGACGKEDQGKGREG